MKKNSFLILSLLLAVCFIPEVALASTKISEFNTPMETFVGIFTGPVGKWISIAGMTGVGLTLIFKHEDMTGGMKTLLGVVFAICFIAFANTMVDHAFTFNGAML